MTLVHNDYPSFETLIIVAIYGNDSVPHFFSICSLAVEHSPDVDVSDSLVSLFQYILGMEFLSSLVGDPQVFPQSGT